MDERAQYRGDCGRMRAMFHEAPKEVRSFLAEGLQSLLFGLPKLYAFVLLVCAVIYGAFGNLLNGSGIEMAFEFLNLAAPPLISAQFQLMVVVGFVLYLGVISCRDLPAFAPTYVSNRLLPKILELGRGWMSLVLGDTKILYLPNMTSRWFAYPERAANQGTRYLPGDSPQLE